VLAGPRRAALAGLLEEVERQARARRPKLPEHPALLLAAREMHLAGILMSSVTVLEFAALAGIECDERTAQRYLDRARRVWGGRIPMIESGWHLVEVLRDDCLSRSA
jgi:hypothetical protein